MRALFIFIFCGCAWAQQYVIATVAGGAPPATPLAASRASIGDPARVIVDAAGNVYFASLHSIFKVDAAGAVYIADTFNGRIRRVAADGSLVTVAGIGTTGVFGGDNNPAERAALSLPTDVSFDRQGNLYIVDFGNGRIRKVTSGIIS